MALQRSRGPYIWVTTLAKLLTSENSCEWAGWFKAHHEILISNAKTGRPSPSHQGQIRIYQYAVPKPFPKFQSEDARGQARYRDSYVGSPASAVSPECRFCYIRKEDCPAKIDVNQIPEGTTDEF